MELPAGRFPAWRIRIVWEIAGPQLSILVWYGASGFLQMIIHDEETAGDEMPPGGTVIYDETQVLQAAHLVRTHGR